MFRRVRNFVYRNRQNFLYAGIVCGGFYFAGRYLVGRFIEWQKGETKNLLLRLQRKQHFDNTQNAINSWVLNLSKLICDIINKELDADTLLQAIKDQPSNATSIWQQLKVVGISRALATVLVSALVTVAVEVHMMVWGSYSISDMMKCGKVSASFTVKQDSYISSLQYLMETGIKEFITDIHKVVKDTVQDLPLGRRLSLRQLEEIIVDIQLKLTSGKRQNCNDCSSIVENEDVTLKTWSHYAVKTSCIQDSLEDDYVVSPLLEEVQRIMARPQFHRIMNTLCQHGFNFLLDFVTDSYPPIDTSTNKLGAVGSGELYSTGSSIVLQSKSSSTLLDSSVLPVAKIIPMLSRFVYVASASDATNIMHKYLQSDSLAVYGAEIYDELVTQMLLDDPVYSESNCD